ncbi:LysE family translocator [Aquitalea sp. S1-19]|uniref:LysE family transporter n=1 Tax=Craterilacuibacter sinensis TaxID=2686017 RepID=A0A845BUS7_9NEIS|nr:LysE family translocator [Craterilacuibacter sinensis]MCP9760121.1 LysE family translocator [Aquitalea sp. S1-19]MXR38391.1 LysE family transporter [Craterilacuibacter sinensis]RQW22063.1 LysE family translocator [Rhodobacteraceae bacterium CH30]
MFPFEVWLAYTAACVLLIVSPGPDNLLAIGRGLSQGWRAALVSSLASGAGILFHVLLATCGLTLLMKTSMLVFWIVKGLGAGYLVWLGIKALRTRSLISFEPAARQPMRAIFLSGLLSAVLNPKPGLFVLAFIPQFVSPARGDASVQMLIYGAWFAALTCVVFALMGAFASRLAGLLQARPRVVAGLNIGAGSAFVAAGLSVATLSNK